MLEKLKMLPFTMKWHANHFLKELKEDERGLSGVVVAVLLILVAVLAIVFLWDSLSAWLEELWEKIIGQGNSIG